MPTGYTAPLHDDKDITFEQFVLRCARGMGAAIAQRDESLDSVIRKRTVSSYHKDALDKAAVRLKQAASMTKAEAAMAAKANYADAMERHEASMAKRKAMKQRYQVMLDKVRDWIPPTTDHEGLKTFMIQQLEESIDFDCVGFGKYQPRRLSASEYIQQELAGAKRDIEYHAEEWRKEIERVREQNEWVEALADDLGVDVE